MSDQNPPVPGPANAEQPPTASPDETAALPQADGAVPAAAGDTAQLPPQPAAGWAAAPTAAAPAPPGWTPTPPSGPRRWWDEATSTGGGRAALLGVAVLAGLFVLAGVALSTALVVGNHFGDDDGFVTSNRGWMGQDDQMGPGNRNGMGQGQGNGNGNGNGKNKGQGNPNGKQQAPGQANPADPGIPGLGRGRGAGAAPGAVLHGEFTTDLTGTPTVMVVQSGQVTAYTPGKSLTVKSTDGYEATYTLDATTATTGKNATQLANGVQVRVLAAKEGMKVTALVVGD